MSSVSFRSVRIEARDKRLLRDLFESRVMTIAQAAALHFDDSVDAATKRVQKLKAGGFLAERPRRFNERAILHLTTSAIAFLSAEGILADYPKLSAAALMRRAHVSSSTIVHELSVMNVKAAFVSRMRKAADLRLDSFITWPLLLEFTACCPDGRRVSVKPDAFLKFYQHEVDGTEYNYRFFVELDRGTEVQETLATRAACYRDYYRSGAFACRCGGTEVQPEQFPFRTLFVFSTPERRNNAAERMLMLSEPIGRGVCLSTLPEVLADPFAPIWTTPKNYQVATHESPFDPERRRHVIGYSRSAERERFVEAYVQKLSILE